MNEKRGPWYLLTGLIIGIGLGLLYAWVIRPVQYTNTTPSSLRADFKDQYRVMIAAAYMANGDLLRARARLELLQDADLYRALAEQAQRTLADGSSQQEARALGVLAVALGQAPATPVQAATVPVTPTLASDSPTSAAPTLSGTSPISPTGELPTLDASAVQTSTLPAPVDTSPADSGTEPAPDTSSQSTRTPRPSSTPLPTRTATPTQSVPFVLDRQELVCNPELAQGLLQVQIYDGAGEPVPGVEVILSWDGGENRFFTGLKPEINPGYADYQMTPGVVYTLRLAEGGQIIPDLTPAECERAGGERYWGALRLLFLPP
jgi:hypothetical protein